MVELMVLSVICVGAVVGLFLFTMFVIEDVEYTHECQRKDERRKSVT